MVHRTSATGKLVVWGRWFGFLQSPYEWNCYLGVPQFKSQTIARVIGDSFGGFFSEPFSSNTFQPRDFTSQKSTIFGFWIHLAPCKFNSSPQKRRPKHERKGSSSNHHFFRGELLNFRGVGEWSNRKVWIGSCQWFRQDSGITSASNGLLTKKRTAKKPLVHAVIPTRSPNAPSFFKVA